MASSSDRRRRRRVAVQWPMRLFGQTGEPPVESTTENLSSEGLYCVTEERFRTGDFTLDDKRLPDGSLVRSAGRNGSRSTAGGRFRYRRSARR